MQLVQVDITDPGSIAPAIGNASKVRALLNILADGHCARLALKRILLIAWNSAVMGGARVQVAALTGTIDMTAYTPIV